MRAKQRSLKTGLGRKLDWLATATALAKSEVARGVRNWADSGAGNSESALRIKQAALLATKLGSLKGAAMKLGQLLALEARDYFPDEVVQILEKLQSSADPLDSVTIRQVLDRELGGKSLLLQNFSPEPMAAASIGQVHRAEVGSTPVAVKIQYPGVDQSLESDIALLKQAVKLLSYLTGRREINSDGVIEEIAAMFAQEMDYRVELQYLSEFHSLASKIPEIQVPKAFPEFSTSRVLTSELLTGITISEIARDRSFSSAKRQFYADLFMRLFATEFCEWGLVQTDPNLGNFLVSPDHQRLILLDFGACRRYSVDFRVNYSRLVLFAFHSDRARLLEIAIQMKLVDPREAQPAREALVNLIIQSMAPFRKSIYDFSEGEYAADMRRSTQELIQQLRFSPPPRELIFLHRKLGGIFQILRRLEAKCSLKPYLEIYERTANTR